MNNLVKQSLQELATHEIYNPMCRFNIIDNVGRVAEGSPRTSPPCSQAKKRLADAAIRTRNMQQLMRRYAEQVYAAPAL